MPVLRLSGIILARVDDDIDKENEGEHKLQSIRSMLDPCAVLWDLLACCYAFLSVSACACSGGARGCESAFLMYTLLIPRWRPCILSYSLAAS